jgi:uncharacterized protein YcbX
MATVEAAEVIRENAADVAALQGNEQWQEQRLSALETGLAESNRLLSEVYLRLAELTPPPSEPLSPISEEPTEVLMVTEEGAPVEVLTTEADPPPSVEEESPAQQTAPVSRKARWV